MNAIRDEVVANMKESSKMRKKKLDERSKLRRFKVGDKVLLRTPGVDGKLVDACKGPYEVSQVLGEVTYQLNLGGKRRRVAHVNTMKAYEERAVVKKVTMALEEEGLDELMVTNEKVKIIGEKLEKAKLEDVEEWCGDFKDVLTEEPGLTHLVKFGIDTGQSPPIAQRPYSTPVALKPGVDDEIDWLLQKGYVRESDSLWASPIITVKKPNGNVRLCVDFKQVNSIIQSLLFYMPCIEEVIEPVGKAGVVSKMDLSKGYYQVAMEPEDVCKTAFTCHWGKFEFLRIPFGVKNAPAIFQILMDKVLKGLEKFSRAYMDDIIIYSATCADHKEHVKRVLQTLRDAELTANPAKCQWGGESIQFLGHQLDKGAVSVPPQRVAAIRNYDQPRTKNALRVFLGTVSFYRKFSKNLAQYTAVLSPAMAKAAPSRVLWSGDMEDAFNHIRKSISDVTLLVNPLPEDDFSLVTDASGLGLGAFLQV